MFRLRAISGLIFFSTQTLFGGVVLDGSFGTSGALPGPNYMIQAGFGKTVGNNLFHSFNQFDLISSESATFTGPSNIQNIVSRVTGGSASSIDGVINSQIQGANLFFVNPAGVIFGSNAQINVSGSVAISTANYLKLADGGRFNANLGGGDTLTSAPVSAFGFLNAAPAPVFMIGSTLNIAPEKSFSAIAGDTFIVGGLISGQGSRARVNLVSVRSAGEAIINATDINSGADVSQFSAMGQIDLINSAQIDTSGPQGGPISIRGGNLYLDSSSVSSQTTGPIQGGPIDIALLADLTISNGAFIFTSTFGGGNGGALSINARTLSIDGSAAPYQFTGIASQTAGSATGRAGDLTITVDQALSIVGGGVISADTFSFGSGGNLNIHAGSLLIDGSAALGRFTRISAESGATGHGGDLTVSVERALSVVGGGEISTDTFSSGNGGNLAIHARSLTIDGSAAPAYSTFISTNSEMGATGKGGDLNIRVDQGLSVVASGQISTSTSSSSDGGNLKIHAGSFLIDGSAAPGLSTGIFAESDGGGPGNGDAGNAGDLTITVDRALSVVGSGEIFSFAFFGNGGDVKIHAGSLAIDGSATPDQFTGISGASPGVTGKVGDLIITVDHALSLLGGCQIAAGTSFGDGGNVTIHAGSLLIDDGSLIGDQAQGTGDAGTLTITVEQALKVLGGGQIAFQTFSSGKGGTLTIHAGSLSMNGSGRITGDSYSATTGGDLTITVDHALNVNGGSDISANALSSGKGGDVTVHAGNISLRDGGSISAASFASGAAGSVIIDTPGSITLGGGSFVSTSSDFGDAGSIKLVSGGTINLMNYSSVSVSALVNGGDITIKAPVLVSLINSEINARAGSIGGNITIDPIALQLKNSTISASAGGQGGHIDLFTSFLVGPVEAVIPGGILLAFNSSITFEGGLTNGTVNITAPDLDLGSQLITLPSSLVSAENQLRERCTALLEGDFSSFISIGRGGTEPEPDELQSEF